MRCAYVLIVTGVTTILGCTGDTGPAGPEGEPGMALLFYDQFDAETISSPPWTLTGDADWHTRSSSYSIYGDQAAESGDIDDGQTTAMSITGNFPEAGLVNFVGSVNSEAESDWFRWKVDGNTIDGASGSSEGGTMKRVTASFPVPAGTHTIEWSYEKNDSVSFGSDRAVLHAVIIVNYDEAVLHGLTTVLPDGIVSSKSGWQKNR